jgi:hypothetical protein
MELKFLRHDLFAKSHHRTTSATYSHPSVFKLPTTCLLCECPDSPKIGKGFPQTPPTEARHREIVLPLPTTSGAVWPAPSSACKNPFSRSDSTTLRGRYPPVSFCLYSLFHSPADGPFGIYDSSKLWVSLSAVVAYKNNRNICIYAWGTSFMVYCNRPWGCLFYLFPATNSLSPLLKSTFSELTF